MVNFRLPAARPHLLFRREPYPAALDAELTICDVPVLVGLAAVGRLGLVVDALPSLRYPVSARPEASQLWADGVDGAAEVRDTDDLEVRPTDSHDAAVRERLLDQVDALENAWAGPELSQIEARSAAVSFTVAKHRGATLLSHREPHWRVANPRNRPRRVLCVGGVELALWLARSELSPADAWQLYTDLAQTVAGEQPSWPVDRDTAAEFTYWAEEAVAGRL